MGKEGVEGVFIEGYSSFPECCLVCVHLHLCAPSPVSGTVRPAVCATVSPWWRSSPCKELSILFSPRPQHCQVTSGVTAANIRNRNLEIIPTLGAECRALHSEIMMPDQRTSSNVQT